MPRDWAGSVFTGDATIVVNWKEWGTERWRRTKGFATKSEAHDFLAKKRKEYRERRSGTFDEFAAARRRPLLDHVIDFRDHILANRARRGTKRSERHADLSKRRLTDSFAAMKARSLADITSSRVDRFLSKLLDVDGLAIKTRNDYAAVLKQFSRWATADGRLERDVLGNVRKLDNLAGPAKKQKLDWRTARSIASACVLRLQQRLRGIALAQNIEAGRLRALAVITVFLTGLRNNELAQLQWSWIDFAEGLITVPHTASKTGRTEFIPLHDGLAELLQQVRQRRAAAGKVAEKDLVVGVMRNGEPALPHHLNDRLRDDLKFAGGQAVDGAGRTFSLYAMRGSFATQLTELGAPDGVVSELMRHGPGDVTRQHYVQRSLRMLRQAVNLIPAEAAHVEGLYASLPTALDPLRADEHRRASDGGGDAN